jgi:hypothetical protein
MKVLQPVFLLLILLLLPLQSYADVQGFARLTLIEGDVQIRGADTDDWVPAAVNTPLYEGDSIWTPAKSRTELQLLDGTVIRLDSRSSLSILQVDEDALQFHLGMGRIYVRTGEMKRWSMQFDVEDSTVRIVDKSRLRMEIAENGEEEISVFRGSAYVESYGNRTRVRKGEMLSMEDARAEISPVSPPDSWDRWNTDRDRDSRSARHADRSGALPEELAIYEDELSSSGQWLEVREYGRVWRPSMVLEADWAPYRSGRWVWRGGDYVWVSYEPWGWAPYHYGRWAVVSGFGWCWVPPLPGDVFWAPGFVGWITTPTYVGWVPLAPGEIYYGRRNYGRHSVTVTNVTNITVVNNANVYRNSFHRHAVTSVERDGFISGRGRYTPRSNDFFKREKVTAGRPEPRRQAKEVLMPQVRKIPSTQLPPAAVVNRPVRDLRERFPKVDRGGVFVPQREKTRPAVTEPSPRDKLGRIPGQERPGQPAADPHRKPQPEGTRRIDATPPATRPGRSPVPIDPGSAKKGDVSKPPLVKPVVPQSPENKTPSRDLPATERQRPELERPGQHATDPRSKPQPEGNSRIDATPAVTRQGRRPVQTDPGSAQKGDVSRPPQVKPVVPLSSESKAPSRDLPSTERQRPGQERREHPAAAAPDKQQPAPSRPQPAEVQVERKGQGIERREQSPGRRDQVTRTPDKVPDSRDGGRKAAATPERKATKVWEIKQEGDTPPAKEKR